MSSLSKLTLPVGACALLLACGDTSETTRQGARTPAGVTSDAGASDASDQGDGGAPLGPGDGGAGDAATPPPDPTLEPLPPGVATLAGSAERGQVDDLRTRARFSNPVNVAVSPEGNVYVADYDSGVIRVVSPDGLVATLVHQTGFARPFGLVFTPDGSLYAQTDANDTGAVSFETGTFWRIDRRYGRATPLLRNAGRPRGVSALPDGRLFFADPEHHVVGIFDPVSLRVIDLAGERDQPGYVDDEGHRARFNHPYDTAFLDGRVVVVDQMNHRLRAVTLDGHVTTYAGAGTPGNTDGDWMTARFNRPQGAAVDAQGNLYVTDMDGYSIRRVSHDGHVTTVAGAGRMGYRDGEPSQALFSGLEGIDLSPDGAYLYIADGDRGLMGNSHRVRRLTIGRPASP